MNVDVQARDPVADFDPLRPRLVRLAYRMLGTMGDAEDIVQEAFLRWMHTDRAAVREPAAFLRRVVARLCLDELKSARRRRETYRGPWLPEPIVDPQDEIGDDLTTTLMVALERLSPLERAAFLLHDVFDTPFEEIAATLDRDPAACRQLAARARAHVREARPRFPVPRERGLAIAEAFFAASRSGDMAGLRALLSEDVVVLADGGGKRRAALRTVTGIEDVMKLQAGLARIFTPANSHVLRYVVVDGLPGFVSREGDGIQTTALDIDGGRIRGIYVMRNPDKLARIEPRPSPAASGGPSRSWTTGRKRD